MPGPGLKATSFKATSINAITLREYLSPRPHYSSSVPGEPMFVSCLYNGPTPQSPQSHAHSLVSLAATQPTPSVPAISLLYMDPQKNLPRVPDYAKFRVLIIGRANAGKTSILQRVCDTTENPEIRVHRRDESEDDDRVCSPSH
jgi:hypothetical protein